MAFGAALFLTLVLTAFSMRSRATEEPDYPVVRELADIHVRQFAACAVAKVVVPGPAREAGNQRARTPGCPRSTSGCAAQPVCRGPLFGLLVGIELQPEPGQVASGAARGRPRMGR